MTADLALFAPGPVHVPERIRRAANRPLVHHRTPEFAAVVREIRDRLPRVWQTPGWEPLVFSCSGSGAMEGAVANFMTRDGEAAVISAGKFGERWAKILRAYGCTTHELRLPWGSVCHPDRAREFLRRHPRVRAIYLTSADTSTGVVHPTAELCAVAREVTDALIVVDNVCDLGGVDLRPTEWGADVVVSASQKCMMCPPGLGLASVAPRAWEFNATCDLPRFYFDWHKERDRQQSLVTGSTSAVTLLWALRESLRMLEEEGLANVFARHRAVGWALRDAMTSLGLSLFPEESTDVVTVVRAPDGIDGVQVYERMASRHGYRIANGQDEIKGRVFRIGHMGAISPTDLVGVVSALEATLVELGWRGRPRVAVSSSLSAVGGES